MMERCDERREARAARDGLHLLSRRVTQNIKPHQHIVGYGKVMATNLLGDPT